MQDTRFESLGELLSELKRKKTHQKSYCHLHYYARRFWTGYQEPVKLSKVQINNLMSFFGKVEATFERAGLTCSFFSYPWLCRKLLLLFGFGRFTPFVKSIICKKRIKKYESLWTRLGLDIVLEKFRVRLDGFTNALTNRGLVASDRPIAAYSLLEQPENSLLWVAIWLKHWVRYVIRALGTWQTLTMIRWRTMGIILTVTECFVGHLVYFNQSSIFCSSSCRGAPPRTLLVSYWGTCFSAEIWICEGIQSTDFVSWALLLLGKYTIFMSRPFL